MKRSFIVLFLILCCTLFVDVLQADATMTINGTWDYTLKAKYSFSGTSADITEIGVLSVDSHIGENGVEMIDGYTISGDGQIITKSNNEYPYMSNMNTEGIIIHTSYLPGKIISFSYTGRVTNTDYKLEITLYLTQTDAQTMTGYADITYRLGNGQPKQPINYQTSVSVKKRETLPSWKIGGKWEYKATIPKTNIMVQNTPVSINAEESGTIQMNVITSGDIEILDSCVTQGTGTWHYATEYGEQGHEPYSLGPTTKQMAQVEYRSGMVYRIDNGILNIMGLSVNEELYLKQTDTNKIEGEIILYYSGQVARGTVTATRPQPPSTDNGGGGSGCMSGISALALLLFVPLAMRKRKN